MRKIAVMFLCGLLGGCAQNLAPVYFMPNTVDISPNPVTDATLGDVVITAAEQGVEEHIKPENFRIAVMETIKRANIFGANSQRPISIKGHILRAEFPSAGFTMTSTLDVRYIVTMPDGSVLMDEAVRYTGQGTAGEEFFGSARALLAFQRANEGHFTLFLAKLRDSVRGCCR